MKIENILHGVALTCSFVGTACNLFLGNWDTAIWAAAAFVWILASWPGAQRQALA